MAETLALFASGKIPFCALVIRRPQFIAAIMSPRVQVPLKVDFLDQMEN
jgi:hypothetical protein